MQNGEWWIDESGHTEYVDGDIGETNHEIAAFRAALELDDDSFSDDVQETWAKTGKITPAQAKVLRERGVNLKALTFFQRKNVDARDYALEHMGWVRVRMRDFQVHLLDDARLELIQGADFWDEGDENEGDDTVNLEEMASHGWWNVSFKVLLGAQSAEGLKRYVNRAAAGRRLGGLARPGRWMRLPGGR